jgi:GNAT superfamily N-acetyltransferase
VTIRHAVPADAAVLAGLARTTFYETFAATNDVNDMALHLERAYGVPQQSAEISDPQMISLLVEENGEAVAYAQMRPHHPPECVTGPEPIELWRFYVGRRWHGKGIAQQLMERVWEQNARARAFYEKCGFVDVGSHVFLFGTDPQTDRVMAVAL